MQRLYQIRFDHKSDGCDAQRHFIAFVGHDEIFSMYQTGIGVICKFIYGVAHITSVRRESEMLPYKHLTGALVSNREVRVIADAIDEVLAFVAIRNAGIIKLVSDHHFGF